MFDLDQALQSYPVVKVSELSQDNCRRYLFIRELEKGLSVSLLTYSHRSNVGNYHFIWKLPDLLHEVACSIENSIIIAEIIPVYQSQAIKQQFCELYGRIHQKVNPVSFVTYMMF